MTVRLIGPFAEHRVVVDDRQVPFLTAAEVNGGMVNLVFDDRFTVLLPMAVFDDVTAFIATVIEQCFKTLNWTTAWMRMTGRSYEV